MKSAIWCAAVVLSLLTVVMWSRSIPTQLVMALYPLFWAYATSKQAP